MEMRRHHGPLVVTIGNQFPDGPKLGAEIGVWDGKLSEVLLRSFPDLHLYMIDPWELLSYNATMPGTKEQYIAARNTAEERTRFAENRRTILQAFSPQVIRTISRRDFDFVFIDGGHLYEEVHPDIAGNDDGPGWWEMVRPGGLFSGHDYNGKGDRRRGWGVKRAVDEWAEKVGQQVQTPGGLVWWMKKT